MKIVMTGTFLLVALLFAMFGCRAHQGSETGSLVESSQAAVGRLPAMTLSASVNDTGSVPMPRNGAYLAMGIPYQPVRAVYDQLVGALGRPLKNRGEAHITVVEPTEFSKMRRVLSMSDLEQLAQSKDIQNSRLTVVCLGRGIARKANLATYFIVVKSEDLLNLRTAVADLYQQHGGHPGDFDASHFTPHITVGFTDRDLFEQDGVVKDDSSCVADLHP